MTDPRKDDWSDLAQVWTTPDAAAGSTAEPGPDLARRLRRRARLATLNFHVEAWGAVIGAVAGGWFAFHYHAPVVGAAAVAFSIFALVATLWARRGLGAPQTATPRDALSAALRQARAGLRWARAGQAISLAGVLFVAVMGFSRPFNDGLIPVYGSALAILGGAVLFYERHARRSRRRARTHAAALADLDAD